jgi:hemin uptake protein HemP
MLMLVQSVQSADRNIVMSEPIPVPPTDPDAPQTVSESVSTAHAPSAPLPSGSGGAVSGLPKIIRFDSLARCGDEIWIENEGQIYRLRKTRQGKLILTK